MQSHMHAHTDPTPPYPVEDANFRVRALPFRAWALGAGKFSLSLSHSPVTANHPLSWPWTPLNSSLSSPMAEPPIWSAPLFWLLAFHLPVGVCGFLSSLQVFMTWPFALDLLGTRPRRPSGDQASGPVLPLAQTAYVVIIFILGLCAYNEYPAFLAHADLLLRCMCIHTHTHTLHLSGAAWEGFLQLTSCLYWRS